MQIATVSSIVSISTCSRKCPHVDLVSRGRNLTPFPGEASPAWPHPARPGPAWPGPARPSPAQAQTCPSTSLCSAPHTSPLGTVCRSYGQQEIREGSGGLPAEYLDMCSLKDRLERREGAGMARWKYKR